MGRQRAAVGILLALMVATPLHAQRRSCEQVLESTFHRLVNARGEATIYFRDPVRVFCTGGVRLEADSAVLNQQAETVELVGNVVYQDSVRRLEADWANYLGGMDQLLARGNAVIEDLAEGAVISGEQLNYLRETEDRPEARLVVIGGRPHAVLPSERPEPAADTGGARPAGPARGLPASERIPEPEAEAAPEPTPESDAEGPAAGSAAEPAPETHVWANRLQMEGAVFRGEGDVELERGELVGSGRLAVYDRELGRMTLSGGAHLVSEGYQLFGEQVVASLEDEELRELVSRGDARALSDELEIRSQRIRIQFESGEVRGMEAWNMDEEAARIWARARDFELRADSMRVMADSAGIRELHAVGRAYGERTGEEAGGEPARVPRAPLSDVERDWVQGDTILGFFDQVDAVEEGDSVRTVLERIEVAGGGGPALSLYRMAQEEGDGTAINFMKASRIVLFMEEGDVSRVEAEGPIEGLYLEPGGAGRVSEEEDEEGATDGTS